MCIFLNDGSFISATSQTLRRFGKDHEILWEVKDIFHHQLNLSPDGQRILSLSSNVVKRNGKDQRDDVFIILDLNGKVLHRESFYPHMVEKKIRLLNWTMGKRLKDLGAQSESSHFNSIYEIPANAYEMKLPWLKQGNIIVNSTSLGVFILSPDVKNVLHRKLFDSSHNHEIHDVQVNPEGEYLFFNNRISISSNAYISAIQKYDDVKKSLTFNFQSNPPEMFYSPACGGVQEFRDMIFFSHVTTGGYYYSKEKETIVSSIPGLNGNPHESSPVQQLKLINANEFLKHSGNESK